MSSCSSNGVFNINFDVLLYVSLILGCEAVGSMKPRVCKTIMDVFGGRKWALETSLPQEHNPISIYL